MTISKNLIKLNYRASVSNVQRNSVLYKNVEAMFNGFVFYKPSKPLQKHSRNVI